VSPPDPHGQTPSDPWITVVRGDIRRLSIVVEKQGEKIDHLHEWATTERARREATEHETTQIRVMPRAVEALASRVDMLATRVDLVEQRGPIGAHHVAAMPGPLGWPLGWWALAAMVLCALAVGGGLTWADLSGLVRVVAVEPARAPSAPPHSPAPPTPDHPPPGVP